MGDSGWSCCPPKVSLCTSEALGQIEMLVPGSEETARHILRETQATIGMSDVSTDS